MVESFIKFMKGKRLASAACALLALAGYAAAFHPLSRQLGSAVRAFGIIPVILAGLLFGRWAGIAAGLLMTPLSLVLLPLAGMSPTGSFLTGLVMATAGGLAGRLRDLTLLLGSKHDEVDRALASERHAVAELREREALLELAQEVARTGSWEWTLGKGELIWSPAVYGICGLSPTRFTPSIDHVRELLHPEDRAAFEGLIQQALADHGPHEAEFRVRHARGSWRTVSGRAAVICDAQGNPSKLIGTAQDVTEQRQQQARLLQVDRTASLGTLAGGVAHEINNPLAYVMANLEYVARELADIQPGSQASWIAALLDPINEARQGAERVRRIVQDLKTFSRGDEDSLGAIDLVPVLEFSLKMSLNEIRHRAHLVCDFGAVPRVLANESRLGQLFVNLLINAAQAIPDGHAIENEVSLVTRTDAQGRAVVEVTDTGCGIAPENLTRIFDPFFTTKPIGVGTGLGLSICHGIVTSFGGELEVESTPGKGSTFRVLFPAAAAAQATQPALREELRPADRDGPVGVLIVDDDSLAAKGLKRLLGPEHQVDIATTGREALSLMSEKRFDVVLCDLMMPEMSGMDLFDEVSRRAPDQAARMLFLTGGAFTPRARAFVAAQEHRILEKPMDIQHLRAVIREHAGKSVELTRH